MKLKLEQKRNKRWQGANYSIRGVCDRCGKRRQVGHIHYIGNNPLRSGTAQTTDYLPDHLQLCSDCWTNIPKEWCFCGCGG